MENISGMGEGRKLIVRKLSLIDNNENDVRDKICRKSPDCHIGNKFPNVGFAFYCSAHMVQITFIFQSNEKREKPGNDQIKLLFA